MKLSTKGRYGARLMLDLALHYGQGPVLLKDIAQRQEISMKYLSHLVLPLKSDRLINSSRGAHGGYTLTREPKDITLAEVVQAVEGNVSLVECVAASKVCNRTNLCVTRDIWSAISAKIMQMLVSITLQDMVETQKQKQKAHTLTYDI